MSVVALKALNVPSSPDGYVYYDEITFGPGSPPPRPLPQPPEPPLGIWGPTDPRPTLPIAGWDPIHGTWPTPPVPPSPGPGVQVTVLPIPPELAPPVPPGLPVGTTAVLILYGDPRTTKPAVAWVQPYASAAPPVAPPPAA